MVEISVVHLVEAVVGHVPSLLAKEPSEFEVAKAGLLERLPHHRGVRCLSGLYSARRNLNACLWTLGMGEQKQPFMVSDVSEDLVL